MDTQPLLSTWIAEAAQRPPVFNHNLQLSPAQFKGFELVNTVAMAAPPGSTETVYLYARRPAGREAGLLRVSVGSHADGPAALLALGQQLEGCMNPQIPRAEGELARRAHIGFEAGATGTAQGPGGGAALFTVGNVTVAMASVGDEPVDVAPLAARLGRWLADPPLATALRAERATAYAPAAVRLDAGQSLTLVERLPPAAPGAPRLQARAASGTLRREGDALVYVAGKAGSHGVALFSHAAPER